MADNLMGFPKSKYVKKTYLLFVASCSIAMVFYMLTLLGVLIPPGLNAMTVALVAVLMPLSSIAMLLGIGGLVLALVGFFLLKPKFSALDQNHLLYLAVLSAIFFVTGLILVLALPPSLITGGVIALLIKAMQILLFFTGYNSWSRGRTIGKDNIKDEMLIALKNR